MVIMSCRGPNEKQFCTDLGFLPSINKAFIIIIIYLLLLYPSGSWTISPMLKLSVRWRALLSVQDTTFRKFKFLLSNFNNLKNT